jgi:hypothetical protein
MTSSLSLSLIIPKSLRSPFAKAAAATSETSYLKKNKNCSVYLC